MPPPTWAYQVDNFSPPPDEELVCSICQAVFCDPVQSPCHHVFCRNCIAKWLESNRNCPICRKRTTRSTLQEVVPLVKNMIMKLTLNCHNSSRGCEEKFSLESCESHIKDCPFELVQCRNKPCNLIFMKKDLSNHEVNNCLHSFIRCTKCQLKMPSRKPKAHNCIVELQKKLKEKSEKLKKNNQKLKKLKEELRKLRSNDLYASVSSSADSLSPADVLFNFTENSNLFSGSSLSSSSAESDVEDYMWPFPSQERIQAEIDFALEHMDDDILSYRSPAAQAVDEHESIEYPRSSSPLTNDDSSILVVEPAEPIVDEPIRRPPKRRLNTRIFDSTDDEDEEVDSSPLPSRKRTWQISTATGGASAAAATSTLDAAGPSYLSPTDGSSTSTNDSSSTSTNDSSPTSNKNKFKPKNKLRSRTAQQRASARSSATASGTVASQNGSPIFERTISLLEQYNLESDPEWLPTHAEGPVDDSDNDIFVVPGHITSSDESSISELDSESSYEDAAEGRTEDLLNRFYGSSDSDSDEF